MSVGIKKKELDTLCIYSYACLAVWSTANKTEVHPANASLVEARFSLPAVTALSDEYIGIFLYYA